jgi:hypothetical protein
MGVRDATTLAEVIRKLKGKRTFTFGVVLELSSQNFNLRKWLHSGGLDPDRDVRTAVVPSALVHETFRAGHLDGYCVAEPWNSAAAFDGSGWTVAATSEVEPDHPEKVLLVLQDFAERREEEHLRMIAALIEAGRFCDEPQNRPELARMLSQPQYLDVDPALLANALVGPFESGHGRRMVKDFVIYDSRRAGAPTRARGKWVFDLVQKIGGNSSNPALRSEIIAKVFREDIFRKAARLAGNGVHKNHASDRVSPFFLPSPPLVSGAPRMETPEIILPLAAMPLHSEPQTAPVAFCS